MATRPEVPRGLTGPTTTVSEIVMPEPLSYRLKKRLLGQPLVTERLSEERLGKPTALGVLSPDCISSTAYGSEEILVVLVQAVGVAAFSLLLPITLAVIVVLFFVTMSYREVVMVYTKAGGSYVVARENFGVRVAQIAAVALIIDYVVTVAVQTAAGTDALTSAFPTLRIGHLVVNLTTPTTSTAITVAVVLLLFYGNLRGLREAGRTFALPTYLFIFSVGALIIIGVVEWALGDLHQLPTHHLTGQVPFGTPGGGLLEGAGLVIVLRAFANGGSSLTGLEAISNGVATFKPPEGPNARRVLVIMSTILGSLVLGVSLIAHATHPVPFISGSPSVLSQEATLVFRTSPIGRVAFYFLQGATMLILYTGANTSFNGFPNLASFVAEDAYLPRRLTRRGHRLVFSNGIIILTIFSSLLLVVTRARVNALVAVYAIGVFTGFTMAGAGMVKHQLKSRGPGWRRRILVNGFAAVLSGSIVLIFAIVKFKEGAWVVVLLFPLLVLLLIRLHKQYEEEKAELEVNAARACEAPTLRRHVVLVFVERLDLATARAIQVGRSFNPSEIRAVHFVLDTREAKQLEWQWGLLGLAGLPLDLVECPDRRLVRAAMALVADVAQDSQTEVSVLLPRRIFEGRWWRVLHDRTAEDIAGHVGDIPHANATIVPFPVGNRKRVIASFPIGGPAGVGALKPQLPVKAPGRLRERRRGDASTRPGRRKAALSVAEGGIEPGAPDGRGTPGGHGAPGAVVSASAPGKSKASRADQHAAAERHVDPNTVRIGNVRWRQRARVSGRVHAVRVQPRAGLTSLECILTDGTGQLVLVFQGRRHVPGIEPGARLIVEGMVGQSGQRPAMINPNYQILAGSDRPEV